MVLRWSELLFPLGSSLLASGTLVQLENIWSPECARMPRIFTKPLPAALLPPRATMIAPGESWG